MPDDSLLTIGQIADRAGINTSQIRFYERVGVLPEAERVAGQRRYRADVLHRLSIIDVAQRAGLSLEEIAPLTGPDNRSADASRHIRSLPDDKLPRIDALITRAQAVKHWLEVTQHCDCESVDVCGLFVDPTLLPDFKLQGGAHVPTCEERPAVRFAHTIVPRARRADACGVPGRADDRRRRRRAAAMNAARAGRERPG